MTRLADVLLEDAQYAEQQAAMWAERNGHFVTPTEREMKLRWRGTAKRQLDRAEADSTRSSITGY